MIIVSLKNVRNVYSVQKANRENMWKKNVCFVERKAARQCLTDWQDTGFPVSPDYSYKLGNDRLVIQWSILS